jgi:23S rRNA (pseudouridine1915-N3)-methyltransferase
MGRIVVHRHGRAREKAYSELVNTYATRLKGRGVKVLEPSKESADDYQANLNVLSTDGILILLDESGESASTELFLDRWRNWRLESRNIHLAIGPVDGFEEVFIKQHQKLSLGPMTMTYEMAAVVLLEQLYRASEIDRGSPYHRA